MNRILLLILAALTTIYANAQTTQPGIVQEYNEKAKKTPLAGVEVTAKYASSTVSDKNGKFTLSFLTGKPGQRIDLRSIKKNGYEIFNKEAVEQWNMNPNKPFVIVMCRSDKFKRIRDNYHKVSSESYAMKLKKEEAALAKLKADGKLKDSEYNQQLLSLRENYEKQLDNLEIYIDRFARIDLSEISSVEQEIIELVQQGKIDEAIQRYEDLNIEDNLVDGINQLCKVKSVISQLSEKEVSLIESGDSLYAMATRQIENLLIDPNEKNIEKAKSIYCQLADNDPDNFVWLWKTGDFLSSSLVADHNLALHYYEVALDSTLKRHDEEHPNVADSYFKIANAYESIGNQSYAIEYYTKALNILEKTNGCDHPEVLKIRDRISSLNRH